MPLFRTLTAGAIAIGIACSFVASCLHSGHSTHAVPQILVSSAVKSSLRGELRPIGFNENLHLLPARIAGQVAEGSRPGAVEHEWPGFYAEARFSGDAVVLRIDDPINRLRVTFDSDPAKTVELSRIGHHDVLILGVGEGKHSVRIDKSSESAGPAAFEGFFVADAADVLPRPPGRMRLIEFIGDSDTVGYGNLSPVRQCTADGIYAATDVTASFGPRLAAAFDADYRMIARSGIGVVRNYGGASGETMATIHNLALPSKPAARNTMERHADLVVVGIGSNDFSPDASGKKMSATDMQDLQRQFETALTSLVRERIERNPGATAILLAFGEYGPDLVEPYRATAMALKAEGLTAKLVVLPRLERFACDWHPSQADHTRIMGLLEYAIRQTVPEWSN